MKRRLGSVCMVIAMLCGLWTAAPAQAAADGDGLVFAKSLGLMDAAVKGDEAVTRAGLAQVIARLTGYADPQVENPLKYQHREGSVAQYDYQRITGQPIFKDVPQSHWAAGYIEHAALGGYMRGTQADKYLFAPDGAATLTDVYESMLKLLGYQPLLQFKGGGVAAVLDCAREARITVAGQDTVTTGVLAEILFRTMKAEVLEQTEIWPSADGVKYQKYRTYMEYAYDMYVAARVRVTANDLTNLNGGGACAIGRAHIGGVEYADPQQLAREYIGYVCDVYYIQRLQSDTPEIRVIFPQGTECRTLDASEAVRMTRTHFYYEANGKIRSEKLSPVVDVVYNHQLLEKWNPAELLVLDGSYRLIDADGDGSVDVMHIKSYQYILVQGVLGEQKKIQGSYQYKGDPLGLDSLLLDDSDDEGEQRVWYTQRGKPAAFSDIQPGMLLAVARGRQAGFRAVEVEILYGAVTGTVDGFSEAVETTDGRPAMDAVQVGAQEWNIAPALYAAGGKIRPGDTGTFYLTKSNLVFAFETSSASDVKYGFLKNVAIKKGLTPTWQFRMLTADGAWITLETGDKLRVNDAMGDTDKRLAAGGVITLNGDAITHVEAQLVRYRADMTKLLQLETVETDLTAITDIDEREGALHSAAVNGEFRLCHAGSMRFYGSQQNLDWKVILTKPCPTFLVPDDALHADEASFAVRDNNFFEYNTPYQVWSYDENAFGQPGALMVSAGSGAGGAAPSKYMFLSEGSSQAIDDDGNPIFVVRGYYRSNAARYPLADTLVSQKGEQAVLQDFRPGNALKIALSPHDEIENYEVLYDYRVQGEYLQVSNYTGSTNYVYGNVMQVDVSSKFLRVRGSVDNDGLDSVRNFWVSVNNPFVAIYDGATKKVRQGSFADLQPGDYVVIRMEDIKPSVFFIYRNVF